MNLIAHLRRLWQRNESGLYAPVPVVRPSGWSRRDFLRAMGVTTMTSIYAPSIPLTRVIDVEMSITAAPFTDFITPYVGQLTGHIHYRGIEVASYFVGLMTKEESENLELELLVEKERIEAVNAHVIKISKDLHPSDARHGRDRALEAR